MTGVLAFFFHHNHTLITIKDATIMSQSFTSMDAGTQTIDKDTHIVTIDTVTGIYHSKPKDDKDIPVYPEPEGDPSY